MSSLTKIEVYVSTRSGVCYVYIYCEIVTRYKRESAKSERYEDKVGHEIRIVRQTYMYVMNAACRFASILLNSVSCSYM